MPADGPPPDVLHFWRRDGLRRTSIALYRRWSVRFAQDCARQGQVVEERLTRQHALAFAERYAEEHGLQAASTRGAARKALHAWSCALRLLGRPGPEWCQRTRTPSLPRLLRDYTEFRQRHRGVAPSSLRGEVAEIQEFLAWVRPRRRSLRRIRIVDVDAWIVERRRTLARRTVARRCASLRAFLRFLHATGRLAHDLAASVVAPLVRTAERPPRALPWEDVRRIIRAVDRTARTGRRDHALLLTMAMYGMGAGEVLALRLDDIHWRGGTLRVVRPKTRTTTVLPLLPEVARAIAAYIRHGRSPLAPTRIIFVSAQAPHGVLSGSSAVRHMLIKHARKAGVSAPFLGSHALRHSHACRQVDHGAHPKIVGDILGHRRPESTSAYVRVAIERLRGMALPVPR